jgi:hypothetical protein
LGSLSKSYGDVKNSGDNKYEFNKENEVEIEYPEKI